MQPDAIARAQERIDAERDARQVYLALDCLTVEQRAVFELVALDGLSLTDAARATGIKPATARVRLHRARRTLQTRLMTKVADPSSSTTEVLT